MPAEPSPEQGSVEPVHGDGPVGLPDDPSAVRFVAARPVWLAQRGAEMNLPTAWRAVFHRPADAAIELRVAAAYPYRAMVNGRLVGYGPARAAKGYFRVDRWRVSHLRDGANVLAIETVGYHANSYYFQDQPAFLQAELLSGDRVLAATGEETAPLAGRVLEHRRQRVARYSWQRLFSEAYRLTPQCDHWRHDAEVPFAAAAVETLPPRNLLPRRIGYPRFERIAPVARVATGQCERRPPAEPFAPRWITEVGTKIKGFGRDQFEIDVLAELDRLHTARLQPAPPGQAGPVALEADRFAIDRFAGNRTGFVGVRVRCESPARLLLLFDELLTDGDVDFRRLSGLNAISLELSPGVHIFESFEPYTLQYLKTLCERGRCEVVETWLREYAAPDAVAEFDCPDGRLVRAFEAGRQTYRQNAADLLMDCPSRERAGWLCDSFFTGRAAATLTGHIRAEQAFLENFALPTSTENLPPGMLPMCCPADHPNGRFIPNWAMWFALELEEFAGRGGDPALVADCRGRLDGLVDYFAGFLNSDGLLERLDSWVFIEWSRANDFVQDVNYPSNMLYAAMLDAIGRLNGRPELTRQADAVRAAIREQSFDGEFFVDNAIRQEGRLRVTGNRSEVGQYFAFFFDVASPQSHPQLWRRLVEQFGPGRPAELWPDVHPANAFIGNMLRLEILSRFGRSGQVLRESADYFGYMADATGTLWEMIDHGASCNHGFASHVCHALSRDVLGVRRIDPLGRRVELYFDELPLTWCAGRLPVGQQWLHVEWSRRDKMINYFVGLPERFELEVAARPGLTVNRVCDRASLSKE